jgi:hypothetical protein
MASVSTDGTVALWESDFEQSMSIVMNAGKNMMVGTSQNDDSYCMDVWVKSSVEP